MEADQGFLAARRAVRPDGPPFMQAKEEKEIGSSLHGYGSSNRKVRGHPAAHRERTKAWCFTARTVSPAKRWQMKGQKARGRKGEKRRQGCNDDIDEDEQRRVEQGQWRATMGWSKGRVMEKI